MKEQDDLLFHPSNNYKEFNEVMERIMASEMQTAREMSEIKGLFDISPQWLTDLIMNGDPLTVGAAATGMVLATWALRYGINNVIEFIQESDQNSTLIVVVSIFSIVMMMSQGVLWVAKFWLLFMGVLAGINIYKKATVHNEDDKRPMAERVKEKGLRLIKGGKQQ